MTSSVSADDLVARIALDDEALTRADPPLVVVDLDGAAEVSMPASVRSVPVVLVGLGDATRHGVGVARALDCCTDDPAVVAAVERTVRAAPRASIAAALLLRGRDGRDVDEALVAESTTYSMLQGGPEFRAWRASRAVKATPPDAAPVLVARDGDLLHVTLNRPDRHNAYSSAMRDELVAALRIAVADPELRVLLDGAGRSFSSGGDLDEFGTFPDPATAHVVRLTRSAARLLAHIGDRVEVRLHGSCLGAGIELAAFAGHVVARSDTRMGLPEVPLGLVPGAGGTASLPLRIGRQRTALLALTAEPIDAPTALAWGLIDEVS
ncbi:MAG TPA: enoyl-CoA hydratase/isomerase family protein [Acidimicrobiales bacterium]|nr:enoyl-CoA hydratase/isomerase family protein [Acidimicrobiales bacterium]